MYLFGRNVEEADRTIFDIETEYCDRMDECLKIYTNYIDKLETDMSNKIYGKLNEYFEKNNISVDNQNILELEGLWIDTFNDYNNIIESKKNEYKECLLKMMRERDEEIKTLRLETHCLPVRILIKFFTN